MPERQTAQDYLDDADRHIAAAEQRIASLMQHIEAQHAKGADTTAATSLLAIMHGAVISMRAHRNIIVTSLLSSHAKKRPLDATEDED